MNELAELGNQAVEAPESGNLEQGLQEAITGVGDAIERGETFESQAIPLGEALAGVLSERIEEVGGILEALGNLLEAAKPFVGEHLDGLREGCEKLGELASKGAEWLREHPEVVEAAASLLIIIALAAFEPEVAGKLLSERPELLTGPLEVLLETLGNG